MMIQIISDNAEAPNFVENKRVKVIKMCLNEIMLKKHRVSEHKPQVSARAEKTSVEQEGSSSSPAP